MKSPTRRAGGFVTGVAVLVFAAMLASPGAGRAEAPPPPAPAQAPADPSAEPKPEDLREVVIVLTNGQRLRGVLVREEARQIVLRIAGVETRMPRDQIEQIIPQRPLGELYREMRGLIDDNDVDRLLMLVEWLRGNNMLDEARLEIERVLVIEPRNGDALRLAGVIEQLIMLRDMARPGAERPEREPARQVRAPLPGDFPLLSAEQINLMKVFEVNLANPPRLLIDRETVDSLLDQARDHPSVPITRDARAAFHRKPPAEILAMMFELRARDLYPQVRVLGLPDSMRRFRDHVHAAWLINSCATTRCHGGEEAGRLLLFNRAPTSEAAVFTNFLILDRFSMSGGEPLIDYANPDRSALLQMGLPRHDSSRPHPEARGWTPVFRSRDDRRFVQTVDWIRSMHRPRPDYPVQYEPPTTARTPNPIEPEPQDR